MSKIPSDKIKFDPISYIDPNGRVFEWQGDIYRAIASDKTEYFRWLLDQCYFKSLQNKSWIVRTEETGYSLDNYGLILKHERIRPITYCFEWPPQMLKEAALLTIKICLELIPYDLILQDAYPWNIYFKGTRPVFVDVGSIVKVKQNIIWEAYQEFCNFFLHPLYLYSFNLYDVTHLLLRDYLNGISDQNCYSLLSLRRKIFCPRLLSRLTLPLFFSNVLQKLKLDTRIRAFAEKAGSRADIKKIRIRFFESLLKEVESIRLPVKRSIWSSYYPGILQHMPSADYEIKQKHVLDILNNIRPKSILDIGCNKGLYSILAAKQKISTISFDTDVNCISGLYENAKENQLDIVPITMNLLDPSPKFGWCLEQFPSAIDRFKVDMCFAFAIIHHLVFSQWQNFDRVVESIDPFAKKWLLIEFIPKEDEKAKLLLSRKEDTFQWYTFDNFIKSLTRKYKVKKIYDSYPANRKLVLCEK